MFSKWPQQITLHLHAFSLVELMVVIAIAGILASAAMPAYKTYVVRSQVASLLPLLDEVKSDVQQAHSDGVTFATTGDDIRVAAAATDKPRFLNEFKRTDYGCIQIDYDLAQLGLEAGSGQKLSLVACPSVNTSGNIILWNCGYAADSEVTYAKYLPAECAQAVIPDTTF